MIVRTVNNYSFISLEVPGAMVDAQQKRKKGRFCLSGEYARNDTVYTGTENCLTSQVRKITDHGDVVTKNSRFCLGTISKDYQEYLNYAKQGIQVIVNWNIFGSKDSGYYLLGDFFPNINTMNTAKIISQEGNCLTIQRIIVRPQITDNVFETEEKVFVCWSSISEYAQRSLQEKGRIADIEYSNFAMFNGGKCKPILKI